MKKVVLFGVPTYGNIGDAAIVLATEEFIKDNLSEYEYIKVLDDETEQKIEELKKILTTEDIILLQGGGNLGDEYVLLEERRRMIIEAFPNNKIILMPQTIYFNNTEYGKSELEKTKKVYNSHKNLTLTARENISLETMKKEFYNANVIFTPDIVMYLNKTEERERTGVLLTLRKDLEKVLTQEQTEKMQNIVAKYFDDVKETDTHLGDIAIPCSVRKEVFENKIEEFRNAELVITDRLHGMIFAAITSTPCIAIGNYNHKIKSSFEWLKGQKYIKFLDNINSLDEAIVELKEYKNCSYNNEFVLKEYKKMIDIINN